MKLDLIIFDNLNIQVPATGTVTGLLDYDSARVHMYFEPTQ